MIGLHYSAQSALNDKLAGNRVIESQQVEKCAYDSKIEIWVCPSSEKSIFMLIASIAIGNGEVKVKGLRYKGKKTSGVNRQNDQGVEGWKKGYQEAIDVLKLGGGGLRGTEPQKYFWARTSRATNIPTAVPPQ